MICYPEKMVTECVDMFSVRFRMHKQVYTHKAVKQVEFMINDALALADPYILIRGGKTEQHPDGMYRMSECIDCMEALSHLNDGVLEVIKQDHRPELLSAQTLLKRIDERKLYACLGRTPFKRSDRIATMSEESIRREIVAIADKMLQGTYEEPSHYSMGSGGNEGAFADSDDEIDARHGHGHGFQSIDPMGGLSNLSQTSTTSTSGFPLVPVATTDLIVEKMHIHYGLKDKNPVARMRFYERKAETGAIGKEVSDHKYQTSLPAVFEEQAVRIFCKTEDKPGASVKNTAALAFAAWCREVRCPTPFPSLSQASNLGIATDTD